MLEDIEEDNASPSLIDRPFMTFSLEIPMADRKGAAIFSPRAISELREQSLNSNREQLKQLI
jgi:hypothetical protein